jgi:hypothetical protein
MQEQYNKESLQHQNPLELLQRLFNGLQLLEQKTRSLLAAALLLQRVELPQKIKQHVMRCWKLKALKPTHKQASYVGLKQFEDWKCA